MPRFEFTITHGQIAVFDAAAPDFNAWTDDHVAQGFAWRPGHAAFGVPDHDGNVIVEADVAGAAPPLDDEVLRMVRVPLAITTDAIVATTLAEHEIGVAPGSYAVVFALRPGFSRGADEIPVGWRIAITLVPDDAATFAILRRDGEMTTDTVLTRTAAPAT